MHPMLVADLTGLTKGLKDVQRRQLPFATSLALTATAGDLGVAWQDEIEKTFDRPTPFTIKSVAIRPARKTALIATVYVKDIAAEYLRPYVEGGKHSLGGKQGLLTPKNVGLNAYGNLTRNKLTTLKGKRDVFVGEVKVKGGGSINGVWQRKRPTGRKGVVRAKGAGGPAVLKLLIRFSDPLPVEEKLPLYDIAPGVVARSIPIRFAEAWARAQATAR